MVAESEPNAEVKKNLRFKAFNIAKATLNTLPTSYLSHKWLAITTGRIIDYSGINEKVKLGFDFKVRHKQLGFSCSFWKYLFVKGSFRHSH